jgi:phosphate transport system substrate-binding protein
MGAGFLLQGGSTMRLIMTSLVALCALGASLSLQAQTAVDKKLPQYKKVAGVSGNLNSIGSDTLNNLMALWAESFRREYPNVAIQVEGKGSGTAPPALIEGTAQLGPMSREMKSEEIDQFEKKHGYKPTKIAVAIDALAVFVHKDNPVKELSLNQLDGIFSKTFASGGQDIRTWGQAGVTGDLASRPISIYGRNSASGTYGYFKEIALFKGDYKDTVKEQPGSSSVVQSVSTDRFAIGYSGIGYVTSGVKALALAGKTGEHFAATYENAMSGKYPLARNLYIYVNKHPKDGMPPVVKQFLTFILSKEGQEIVVKDGYMPLTSQLSAAEIGKL